MSSSVLSAITYANLHGATHTNPATYQEGTVVAFTPPSGRTGYTFTGWTPAAITADMTGAQTVTAGWRANAYQIAYYANGGSGTMAATGCEYDKEGEIAPNGFTRSGYVFKGWATEKNGEVVYQPGEKVKNLTSNDSGVVTLYAKWTPNSYTVDFNPGQGGTGAMSDQPMTYDEGAELYANLFTRTGYTFLGWTDDEGELEEVLFCDGVVVSNLTDEADGEFDLYAIWAANEYTVTFNANGGEGTMADQTFLYDKAQALRANAFTRADYAFAGWSRDAATGMSPLLAEAEVVSNLTAEASETVILYAQWEEIVEPPVTYGPWGEAEAVKNPDKLGPTMLTDMTLELNGAAGAVGDVVAAFRGDTGALCGLGKVMDESGTLSMVCYAPTGTKLHFKVWVAASGVEEPVVVDCDAKSDLTAPTSGAFLSGHALVVSDDKDLTISLGSADWHTVSFNVLPEDPSPAAVFGSVKAKVAAVTQGIEFWMPGKTSSLKAIEIGKGYWVNTKVDDVEWTVSGKTDPKAEIALEEGWNLVGYAPEAEGAVQQVLKIALAAKAVDYVTYGVEFYPGGTLKKMEPGKAYWVHATKAYTLVYDDGAAGVRALPLRAGALNAVATPTYGPWGESEAVKNPDKLGPTFLTDMAVEIDGEPAEYGDVVAVFRGDTGALCGFGKVMDDSGTLTVVCYAPKGVTLSFKVWLSESGVEEPVVVKCDNASKLVAPDVGAFYEGHAISGSTLAWTESVIVNKKVTIETGLKGCKVSGLPKGLAYDTKTGKITGTVTKVTEGVVVKFSTSGAVVEELTLVVRKEVVSAGCEGLEDGVFPAGVVSAADGIPLQLVSETGVKSVKVTKLPAGMKYDSKKGVITGTPTTAGDYKVVLSVTTKSGAKTSVTIPVSVAAMPLMASGTFSGFVSVGEDNFGTFTLTATSAGKLTAKAVTAKGTYSFSKTGWDSVSEDVYSATLKSKKGDVLKLTLDSTLGWDKNQLWGSIVTAEIAATKKAAAVPSYSYGVSAQRRAFGKSWYFAATGDAANGWALAYAENAKAAALAVTLKADGSTAIAGALPGLLDAKGKALKVSASGYANVEGLKDGAIMADFAPIVTVNKVKKALAIRTNLWFDRSNDHESGVGEAKVVE